MMLKSVNLECTWYSAAVELLYAIEVFLVECELYYDRYKNRELQTENKMNTYYTVYQYNK